MDGDADGGVVAVGGNPFVVLGVLDGHRRLQREIE
jgi:hypothetical protein